MQLLKQPLMLIILTLSIGGLMPLLATAQTTPVTIDVDFGGPPLVGPNNGTLPAPERNTDNLVRETLIPSISTRIEKKETGKGTSISARTETESAKTEPLPWYRPRVVGASVRYEQVDFDNTRRFNLDGDIYTINLHLRSEVENWSYGALVMYEFLDLGSFDAQNIDTLAYGQYLLELNTLSTLAFTVNGHYLHTFVDADELTDLNTFGGGASLSLVIDTETWVLSGFSSYQFNMDDSDREQDHQHKIKAGMTLGGRFGDRLALLLFGAWNLDITNYDPSVQVDDDSYFDVGVELKWSLSANWSLNGGYKRVVDLDNFNSDTVFLGTLLRF